MLPRGGMTTSAPLTATLSLLLFLGACPTGPGDDDDDATTADDDDVAPDDDDTAPDDDDTTDDDSGVDDDDDTAPNQPPVAEDDEASTLIGEAVWIDVLSNDEDPEGEALEIEVLGTASHGTVERSAGGVLYTPDVGFSGTDTFDYLAGDDGGLTDGATVTVDVSCAGGFELISAALAGGVGDGGSWLPAVSADGNIVAFLSDAADLVPDDTNGVTDVFVADRAAGTIVRASVSADGVEADGASWDVAISADGSWVAFTSWATNLVEGDTNGSRDVFLWDRWTGDVTRASVTSTGGESGSTSMSPSLSADGRYVAFESWGPLSPEAVYPTTDVWLYDRDTAGIELISVSTDGDDGIQTSSLPSISADGDRVAFSSLAWDLVADDGDAVVDIFVRDRSEGTTVRVNLPAGVPEADANSYRPVLSADGSTVAFHSDATNLVIGDGAIWRDVFVAGVDTGLVERVSVDSDEVAPEADSGWAEVSADGRWVAFGSLGALDPAATAGVHEIYVRDRSAGTTALASLGCGGQPNATDVTMPFGFAADGSGLVFPAADDLLAPIEDANGDDDIVWVSNPLAEE